MFSLSPPWQYLPHSIVQRCTKVFRWLQVGREEALGLFLETGSAFCPEVEITGLLSVQSEGRGCQGKLVLQILCEIMDGCPRGKRRQDVHCTFVRPQGPASGLERQWNSRYGAGPAGIETSSFRAPPNPTHLPATLKALDDCLLTREITSYWLPRNIPELPQSWASGAGWPPYLLSSFTR